MKTTLVCDIECYWDYFLVMFRRIDTGFTRHYEIYEGHPLDAYSVRSILNQYRIVTFNGINYDIPMLTLALTGASCEALKNASDGIIQGGLRSWQFEQLHNVKISERIDHIDLSEVAPGVMISLKQYGGRMHSQRLQDLPIPHDAFIALDQRQVLIDYCGNDLQTTIDLWHKLTTGKDDVIAIRERIGAENGLELRSKSDAQMAEAVLKSTIEKMKGERVYKPDIPAGTAYTYTPPSFLKFTTLQLQQVLDDVCRAQFIVKADGKIAEPAVLNKRQVVMGSSTYAMGIGGLHSCEKSIAHFADDEFCLVDRDVASFYPMLIVMCGLAPRNMGSLFTKVYAGWIKTRIEAKRKGDKTLAQTLKIYLNGLFGKLGSRYSIVYAPDLLIQVTLTGQLVLLMLIERLEAIGIHVVSANTDGIVIRCPRTREAEYLAVIAQWEKDTGMETEETRYAALFSRDINNYVALKDRAYYRSTMSAEEFAKADKDGWHKTKGVFSEPGLQKNVENEICNEAAVRFLEFGVPVEDTIYGCKDVRKFLTMRKVTGGGTYGGEYLGKVVRWYTGFDKTNDIRRGTPNKLGNFDKVATSTGAVPMMELIDMPYDLDHQAYIDEANETLRTLGVTPELRARLAMPNFDLFKEAA